MRIQQLKPLMVIDEQFTYQLQSLQTWLWIPNSRHTREKINLTSIHTSYTEKLSITFANIQQIFFA